MGLLCAAAPAVASSDTATVDVTATILPYAQVTLDVTSLSIIIPAGVTSYGPVYVGGTVLCNSSTTLFTRITKPEGAPGDWQSYPVSEKKQPGEGYDPNLLRIMIWDIPDTGWTFELKVSGESVQNSSDVRTPAAGEVVLTVVPG
jgi:hypothetical protein